MIGATYKVVETGEDLGDALFEAFERFAAGYNIAWYLDGEYIGLWDESEREQIKKDLFTDWDGDEWDE